MDSQSATRNSSQLKPKSSDKTEEIPMANIY